MTHLGVVLLGVSLITFGLMHLAPGDPAEIMLRANGVQPAREAVEALRHSLGLDAPLHIQYLNWLGRVLRLDLGVSLATGEPVAQELRSRLPATARLALCSILVAAALALPLGTASALRPGSLLDRLGRLVSLASVSMPAYWLGLLLLFYGAVRLKWFPAAGMDGPASAALPAITLGFGMAGVYIRLIRAGMLDVLGRPYIRAARARGLRAGSVIVRHALRNALLPSATLLGLQIGGLLGGAAIVETLFAWPGIGKFAVDAIYAKDYVAIQGYVLLTALIVAAVNLGVDLLYRLLDPRIKKI
ncbi:ABC transporter permease [Saccharibacillus sp. CPCC 101409]|uniref:nickel ABC transporter permease n=1 Tax=Saccharibacillus sp. CPCC 101409 TaxID=3058041 RepID=UPI002672944C|nr:nickel ABC transporter permease [Saccharibacillus sp. CPCC 101409]MDO3410332.1 ABC transporter permease [Saccharibacillus sp. CPCC 101409]